MADFPLLPLLLTVLTIRYSIIISASAKVQPLLPPPPSDLPSPSPSPSPPPQPHLSRPPAPPLPLPPPPPSLPAQQTNNIIDALIGAGDFNDWANIVSTINPLMLPVSATLFVPQDDPVNRMPDIDAFVLLYHIVPQRLSFSNLQLFRTNTRLPTLLTRRSILITNSTASNFTLDGIEITQPDVYSNEAVAIHGISAVLNYTIYGDGVDLPSESPAPRPKETTSAPPLEPDEQGTVFIRNAACLSSDFPSVFLIVAALLAFKNWT